MFVNLSSPKIHPKHIAFDIIANVNEKVIGVRGQPIVIEDIEAFIVFKEDVITPTSLSQLITDKKVITINDGKGIK